MPGTTTCGWNFCLTEISEVLPIRTSDILYHDRRGRLRARGTVPPPIPGYEIIEVRPVRRRRHRTTPPPIPARVLLGQ